MHPQQVYVAIIGTGGVGKHFIKQLHTLSQRASQYPSAPIYLSVILLSSSKKILFNQSFHPLPLHNWEHDLANSTTPNLSLTQIAEYLAVTPEPVVLVDNTSSQDVADHYPLFLKKGINVVTPNKKAFSGDYSLWEDVIAASHGRKAGLIFHEGTVGAGLPIISTLRQLLETGDEVHTIEGVFSGTMSFLFNNFAPVAGGGGAFSAEVKKAKELGYTEPDPREDLNGLDVARKITILARLCGIKVPNANSFPVQSLVPKELESVKSEDEFLARLPEYDSELEKVKKEAEAEGKVVRYVGSIDVPKQELKVGLHKFDKDHPIGSLKGSDNFISFHTKRYAQTPLIIQGAGAGGDVTAMAVTGDLLNVLKTLHHP